jgi:hypothetical protein
MARFSCRLFGALCAMCAAAIFAASAPRAETVQGAAGASAMLGDILEILANRLADSDRGARLVFDGEASAVAVGESVKMKFPVPRILAEDGSWIRFADIAARITPEDEQAYAVSVDLPQSVSISDIHGRPEFRIEWRESALRGVWRADLEIFPVLRGSLHDIILIDQRQADGIRQGSVDFLSIDQALMENANGLWSGPFSFNLSKLDIHSATENESFSLEHISLTSDISEFDLASWQALSESLGELPDLNEDTDFMVFGELRNAAKIFETMNAGAVSMALSLSNVRFGSPGVRQFGLRELVLNTSYDNGARPGEYRLAVKLDGLEQAELPVPPEFYPRSGSLKLRLEHFPLRQILTLPLREAHLTADTGVGEYEDSFEKFILPLIYANGTVVQLEEFTLRSAAVSLTARATLSARESSAFGIVGNARIEITGLDNLISVAARQAESGEGGPEMLAMLTVAKGLGRPEINAEGEVAYVFDILLSSEGAIMINEIPLDLLHDIGLTSLPQAHLL